MLNYLLQSNIITLFFNGDSVSMNWIAKLINGLINAIGIVGVGVVVFTLILKLITLPLDVYSKASMRKNSLKMEKMRPQLEKLQKQYANDQQMYNAKMMELYKKNGYSMLVLEYAPSRDLDPEPVYTYSEYGKNAEGVMQYKVTMTKTFREDGKYISFEETQTKITTNKDDRDFADTDAYPVSTVYYVETETMVADPSIEESLDALRAEHEGEDDDFICRRYMQNIGRAASEESYHENQVSFLWVKNIWYPDTAFNHPMKNYKDFKSFLGIKDNGNFISETFYNEITANLQSELKEPNGYFILIVVSIGTMFLSQFVMSKSQKAQNELQTANGQGAKTQKIMMIVMPIMFGIFSFMYSAAFSIYMIVSSVFGILSSLGTNFIIDKKYKKLEEKELQEKYNRRIPQSAKSEVITRNEKKKR